MSLDTTSTAFQLMSSECEKSAVSQWTTYPFQIFLGLFASFARRRRITTAGGDLRCWRRTDHLVILVSIFAQGRRTEVIDKARLTVTIHLIHRCGHELTVGRRRLRMMIHKQIWMLFIENAGIILHQDVGVERCLGRWKITVVQLQMQMTNRWGIRWTWRWRMMIHVRCVRHERVALLQSILPTNTTQLFLETTSFTSKILSLIFIEGEELTTERSILSMLLNAKKNSHEIVVFRRTNLWIRFDHHGFPNGFHLLIFSPVLVRIGPDDSQHAGTLQRTCTRSCEIDFWCFTVFFAASAVSVVVFLSVVCLETVGSNIDSRFLVISSTSESSSALVSLSVDMAWFEPSDLLCTSKIFRHSSLYFSWYSIWL